MVLRTFHPDKDKEAVRRIWRETGWVFRGGGDQAVDVFADAGRSWVAEVDGEAECLVINSPGAVRYLRDDLALSCVTAVTTSRVARRQGFALTLTARAIAADVADGAAVSALGMFDQGFYNRLGFGTGSYEKLVAVHPASLKVEGSRRVPRRITADDWKLVHASRLKRARGHGACNLEPAKMTWAEMLQKRNGFGLGYVDADGELTHHLWCSVPGDVERGPYRVGWLAWRTPEQLLELMGLIKNLGDQVHVVRLREPAGIQLQDLVDRPFARWNATERSEHECGITSAAYWQMRICDLERCLAAARLGAGDVRFNLRLTDPIEQYLPDDAPWTGVAGDYVVTLGSSSGAEAGGDRSLPTLTASVNALSRLWLGVRPATGLSVTDDLVAPRELLEQLDDVLRLPEPHPDWDF